jgi:hypothetical protein
MRKMSAYARKQRRLHDGGAFNTVAWTNVIQRCRSFDEAPVVAGLSGENPQEYAERALIKVKKAFVAIRDMAADNSDSIDYDTLAHAAGVTFIRAVEIAGEDDYDNPMMPILKAANAALRRCAERYRKLGRWGFDGPAIAEVEAAVDLYETVLLSSRPLLMDRESNTRDSVVAEQRRLGLS